MLRILISALVVVISSALCQFVNVTYENMGCFSAFQDISYNYYLETTRPSLTNKLCAQYCQTRALDLKYSLTFYGKQDRLRCSCADRFSADLLKSVDDSSCPARCDGDLTDSCGSYTYQWLTSTSGKQIQCGVYYNNVSNSYALSPGGNALASVSTCLDWCSQASAPFSVLRYNCWCANTNLSAYLFRNMSLTNCGNACPSNSSQNCGLAKLTYAYTFLKITNSTLKVDFYAEYQGSFAFMAAGYMLSPENYAAYIGNQFGIFVDRYLTASIITMLKACLLFNYEYASVDGVIVRCFPNVSLLTSSGNMTTAASSPLRFGQDLSYYNSTVTFNISSFTVYNEVYRIRPVPNNYALPSLTYLDLGCYSASFADAVSHQPRRCYCGYRLSGNLEANSSCSYACVDFVGKCGGPNTWNVLTAITTSTSTTTTTTITTTTTTTTIPTTSTTATTRTTSTTTTASTTVSIASNSMDTYTTPTTTTVTLIETPITLIILSTDSSASIDSSTQPLNDDTSLVVIIVVVVVVVVVALVAGLLTALLIAVKFHNAETRRSSGLKRNSLSLSYIPSPEQRFSDPENISETTFVGSDHTLFDQSRSINHFAEFEANF